jgi:hypothetical protein
MAEQDDTPAHQRRRWFRTPAEDRTFKTVYECRVIYSIDIIRGKLRFVPEFVPPEPPPAE